ncbi:aminotransferase class I/II-fold pyridoxal phosphate-dependent enzyme [Rudanella paleaurantiibacter]|uniref:Aminotransferase class I/II-fold pyridoxal phosphate-dependent enzyme n=1 Tax=Rudanella paleaurantiibacter TaxID=2614655 RepID=A0A7J5TYL7_9BACT|nr:DegT/DnrJ/EryC1/StrS family aminotransferase [Rudanella paleaurantiibacter]KAB7730171.1 aminotransferase class I/II-fold pyridoxal phosphate-dependent enzyme [Rudanella paleaurantiibacter]
MLYVTKSYLPEPEEYYEQLKRIWASGQLTNDGPLVKDLEKQLQAYLGVEHLKFTTNGTVVLQMALKALDITKEVITTPFSYVATTNAILWENCTPVFADISPDDFNIDPDAIEPLITENTQAILATHVYGNACQIERIEVIARRYNLKVIYDAAHTFGASYKGRSILSYGDLSTCSFHATKVFHTIEGGCIVCHDPVMERKLYNYRSFGHRNDDYFSVGINAKNSEFHAAMGLVMLPKVAGLIADRKQVASWYDARLNFDRIRRPTISPDVDYNYAYYPVVFESETVLLRVMAALKADNIIPRRYFYPSLNTLDFLPATSRQACPVSEDYSLRVLSLPFHPALPEAEVERVSRIINENV